MDGQLYMWHLTRVYEKSRISHTVKICLECISLFHRDFLAEKDLQETRKKLLGMWVTFCPKQAFWSSESKQANAIMESWCDRSHSDYL